MPNREYRSIGFCGPYAHVDSMRSGWVTISDLARCEGVTKTAISRRVARLAAKIKLETRTGSNGAKEVKLDQYEKVTGKRFDPSRIPLDEISRLAVRGEISTLQLMAARRYRSIWRTQNALASFPRSSASMMSTCAAGCCSMISH